ncbi:hypothetical protein N0V90_005110 [Kalmusia sp. IMI 367209]|nr:hypothetical protein N0V90_005110 [Kalmusia sp. IMI 367209]
MSLYFTVHLTMYHPIPLSVAANMVYTPIHARPHLPIRLLTTFQPTHACLPYTKCKMPQMQREQDRTQAHIEPSTDGVLEVRGKDGNVGVAGVPVDVKQVEKHGDVEDEKGREDGVVEGEEAKVVGWCKEWGKEGMVSV